MALRAALRAGGALERGPTASRDMVFRRTRADVELGRNLFDLQATGHLLLRPGRYG